MKTLLKLLPLFFLTIFSAQVANAVVFDVNVEPLASPTSEITFAHQPMAPKWQIALDRRISPTDLGRFVSNGHEYRVLFSSNSSSSFYQTYETLFENIENIRKIPISAAVVITENGTQDKGIVLPIESFTKGVDIPISQAYSFEAVQDENPNIRRAFYYLHHPMDGGARIIIRDKFASLFAH